MGRQKNGCSTLLIIMGVLFLILILLGLLYAAWSVYMVQ